LDGKTLTLNNKLMLRRTLIGCPIYTAEKQKANVAGNADKLSSIYTAEKQNFNQLVYDKALSLAA
jgi:hypothetical protein